MRNGFRINTAYGYYPNGKIKWEQNFDNGMKNGIYRTYYETGKVKQEGEFLNDKGSGLWKAYNQNGVISETANYSNNMKNGTLTNYYDNGRIRYVETYKDDILLTKVEYNYSTGKPSREYIYKDGFLFEEKDLSEKRVRSEPQTQTIPLTNRLSLIEFKTGYIETIDVFNSGQPLYTPIVIMRWKNISNDSISEIVRVRGVFIDNKKNEEINMSSAFLQSPSDVPLQKNITRQLDVRSSTGFINVLGIRSGDISCQLFLNDTFIRTVKIDNILLQTNRLQ